MQKVLHAFKGRMTKDSALRGIYLFLTLGLMAVNLAMAAVNWERGGWDVKHHCVCSEKIESGIDPYLEQARAHLPPSALRCTYPPLIYQVVYAPLICLWNPRVAALMMSLTAVVLLIIMLRPRGIDEMLFVTALLTCGFSAVRNIALSGNIVSLEFLLFGAALILLGKGHQRVSGIVLALAGSIKIQPLALGAGLALILPRKKAVGFLVTFAVAGLIILLGCLYVNPHLMASYGNFLYGTLTENTVTGLVEGGPSYDLSVKNFIRDIEFLVLGFLDRSPVLFLLYLLGVIYLGVRLKKKSWDQEGKIAFAAMLLLLAFPRLKNYTYLLMTVPLIMLFRKESLANRCVLLAVVNLIPLALPLSYDVGYQLNTVTGKIFYFLTIYSSLYAAGLSLYWAWTHLNGRQTKHLAGS